ncbi:hypothetical protein E4U13_000728, partial [Claviceps humidiphila]
SESRHGAQTTKTRLRCSRYSRPTKAKLTTERLVKAHPRKETNGTRHRASSIYAGDRGRPTKRFHYSHSQLANARSPRTTQISAA